MWTTTHCFDISGKSTKRACNLMYIVSSGKIKICHVSRRGIYVQNYRPNHEQTTILLDQLQKHKFLQLVSYHMYRGGGGGVLLLRNYLPNMTFLA